MVNSCSLFDPISTPRICGFSESIVNVAICSPSKRSSLFTLKLIQLLGELGERSTVLENPRKSLSSALRIDINRMQS